MRALPTQRANEITEVDANLTVQPLMGHRIKICLVAQLTALPCYCQGKIDPVTEPTWPWTGASFSTPLKYALRCALNVSIHWK